jgi:predicted porin
MKAKILKLLIGSVLCYSSLSADELSLKQGWNLIGTNSETSLSGISGSLGSDNLLVVQGPTKTYQKAYVDAGTSFLNDFDGFEIGKGYWVKLNSAATLTYTPSNFSSNQEISLNTGWNLIDPLSSMTIDNIKSALGSDNLLVIQGPTKTYQKAYVDAGTSFLNDFEEFEVGKGYWVKVSSSATLTFEFSGGVTPPPTAPNITDVETTPTTN